MSAYLPLTVFLLWSAGTASADTGTCYATYRAEILRVLDGQTVETRISIWPDAILTTKITLLGIHAPAVHTQDECEKSAGLKAKARLEELTQGKSCHVVDLDTTAGRRFGKLICGTQDVSEALLTEGHARRADAATTSWRGTCNDAF